MSEAKAKEQLKRTGKVVFQNAEIWETVDGQGNYTGRYRVAPKGERERFESATSATDAFRKAKAIR